MNKNASTFQKDSSKYQSTSRQQSSKYSLSQRDNQQQYFNPISSYDQTMAAFDPWTSPTTFRQQIAVQDAVGSILKSRKHQRFKNYRTQNKKQRLVTDQLNKSNNTKKDEHKSREFSRAIFQKFTQRSKQQVLQNKIMSLKRQNLRLNNQIIRSQSKSSNSYEKRTLQNCQKTVSKHSIEKQNLIMKKLERTVIEKNNQINSLRLMIDQLRKLYQINVSDTEQYNLFQEKADRISTVLTLPVESDIKTLQNQKQLTKFLQIDQKQFNYQKYYYKCFEDLRVYFTKQVSQLKMVVKKRETQIIDVKQQNKRLKQTLCKISNENCLIQTNLCQSQQKCFKNMESVFRTNKQLSILIDKLRKQLKKKKQQYKKIQEQKMLMKGQNERLKMQQILWQQKMKYLEDKNRQMQQKRDRCFGDYQGGDEFNEVIVQNIRLSRMNEELKRQLLGKEEQVIKRNNIRQIQWKQIDRMQRIFKSLPKQ